MDFTKKEIKDLTISVIVLALVFSRFDFSIFPIVALAVIAVFVTHEIFGHKYFAQRYGCEAHYKKWNMGLFLGIITALIPGGFVFAAPGAVYISPYSKKEFAFSIAHLTEKEFGIIAAAGPAVNLIVAGLFYIINLNYPADVFTWIMKISVFLALFNLLPFGPLDGEKILNWNKKIWGILIAIAFGSYLFLSL